MSQKYGLRLENYTAEMLSKATNTVQMGSKSGSAGNPTSSDIFTKSMQIECKRRNEKSRKCTSTIIKVDVWDKVSRRAWKSGKIPAVVTSEFDIANAKITMRLFDFLSLVDTEKI